MSCVPISVSSDLGISSPFHTITVTRYTYEFVRAYEYEYVTTCVSCSISIHSLSKHLDVRLFEACDYFTNYNSLSSPIFIANMSFRIKLYMVGGWWLVVGRWSLFFYTE